MIEQKHTTSNGHEIEHNREQLTFSELNEMLDSYELNGANPEERASKLRSIDPQNLALFMSDVNRRTQGSDDSLIHDKVMKIGDKETIEPAERYETFLALDEKIRATDPSINPERVGDALALTTVLLHPFKDGNGRTARLLGFIYREDFDAVDASETFDQLAESRDSIRDSGGFMINGYVPYMSEGSSQSSPKDVEQYIAQILTDSHSNLYTGPFGQADLTQAK
jgi:hypothetical protein